MAKAVWLKQGSEKYYPAPYWPIGSIYISVVNTNPSQWFGGVWESFGSGRVLVGVDTTQTEFNKVMKTGGSKYTEKHNHSIVNLKAATTFSKAGDGYGPQQVAGDRTWKNIDNKDITTATFGKGTSGNLQPYITVYMWRRVS